MPAALLTVIISLTVVHCSHKTFIEFRPYVEFGVYCINRMDQFDDTLNCIDRLSSYANKHESLFSIVVTSSH